MLKCNQACELLFPQPGTYQALKLYSLDEQGHCLSGRKIQTEPAVWNHSLPLPPNCVRPGPTWLYRSGAEFCVRVCACAWTKEHFWGRGHIWTVSQRDPQSGWVDNDSAESSSLNSLASRRMDRGGIMEGKTEESDGPEVQILALCPTR